MMKLNDLGELEFEPRMHVYRLDGNELPSVTSIMRPLSNTVYGSIDGDTLTKAANRGTAVHNAIDNYLKFGIDDIAEEHRGYLDAFLDWMHDKDVTPLRNEYRVYHKLLMYAGTADMVAEIGGVNTLVDFKTSASVEDMLCGVQLEAYNRAIESHTGEKCGSKVIVHLKKDGRYSEREYCNGEECWRVFTALLTVRNYKKKYVA